MRAKRKLTIAGIGLIFLLLAFHLFPLNITPSMPYGIYLRLPALRIKVGDYVQIDNPFITGCFGVKVSGSLVKRVVEITEEQLFVLRGEHELSYDSRYFGAIGKEYIRYKLVPIITFETIPEWLAVKEDEQ